MPLAPGDVEPILAASGSLCRGPLALHGQRYIYQCARVIADRCFLCHMGE